jgi:hypothetical protein
MTRSLTNNQYRRSTKEWMEPLTAAAVSKSCTRPPIHFPMPIKHTRPTICNPDPYLNTQYTYMPINSLCGQ